MKFFKLTFLILVALIAGYVGAQYSFTLAHRGADIPKQESVYDRVMSSGKIRCGWGAWKPMLYKDPNSGEMQGLLEEVMGEVGRRLSLEVEWGEETGWGTIVEGLETNRYDMICVLLFANSSRSRQIDFTTPLFYSPLYVAVRKDDTRFDQNIDSLNDATYTMGILDGEIGSLVAVQRFPKAQKLAIPQVSDYSQLLQDLVDGKTDATLMEPGGFKEYVASNPDKLRLIEQHPVSIFEAAFGMPRNDLAFKQMIVYTLREMMNDGTIEKLLTKYEPYPGTYLRVAKPYEIAQ